MHLYTYDGTFEGLLTVVFEAYERKAWPTAIEQEQVAQPGIFGTTIAVVTDEEKSQRVWKGLQQRLSVTACKHLYYTYLWEQPGFELILFNYIKLAFGTSENIEGNFTAPCFNVSFSHFVYRFRLNMNKTKILHIYLKGKHLAG